MSIDSPPVPRTTSNLLPAGAPLTHLPRICPRRAKPFFVTPCTGMGRTTSICFSEGTPFLRWRTANPQSLSAPPVYLAVAGISSVYGTSTTTTSPGSMSTSVYMVFRPAPRPTHDELDACWRPRTVCSRDQLVLLVPAPSKVPLGDGDSCVDELFEKLFTERLGPLERADAAGVRVGWERRPVQRREALPGPAMRAECVRLPLPRILRKQRLPFAHGNAVGVHWSGEQAGVFGRMFVLVGKPHVEVNVIVGRA